MWKVIAGVGAAIALVGLLVWGVSKLPAREPGVSDNGIHTIQNGSSTVVVVDRNQRSDNSDLLWYMVLWNAMSGPSRGDTYNTYNTGRAPSTYTPTPTTQESDSGSWGEDTYEDTSGSWGSDSSYDDYDSGSWGSDYSSDSWGSSDSGSWGSDSDYGSYGSGDSGSWGE